MLYFSMSIVESGFKLSNFLMRASTYTLIKYYTRTIHIRLLITNKIIYFFVSFQDPSTVCIYSISLLNIFTNISYVFIYIFFLSIWAL